MSDKDDRRSMADEEPIDEDAFDREQMARLLMPVAWRQRTRQPNGEG